MFKLDEEANLKKLKELADKYGVSYNANIGLTKLEERIAEYENNKGISKLSDVDSKFIALAKKASLKMESFNIKSLITSKMPRISPTFQSFFGV